METSLGVLLPCFDCRAFDLRARVFGPVDVWPRTWALTLLFLVTARLELFDMRWIYGGSRFGVHAMAWIVNCLMAPA